MSRFHRFNTSRACARVGVWKVWLQDITEDKAQELLRLFPEIRTEGGRLDFDRLKLALGARFHRFNTLARVRARRGVESV